MTFYYAFPPALPGQPPFFGLFPNFLANNPKVPDELAVKGTEGDMQVVEK